MRKKLIFLLIFTGILLDAGSSFDFQFPAIRHHELRKRAAMSWKGAFKSRKLPSKPPKKSPDSQRHKVPDSHNPSAPHSNSQPADTHPHIPNTQSHPSNSFSNPHDPYARQPAYNPNFNPNSHNPYPPAPPAYSPNSYPNAPNSYPRAPPPYSPNSYPQAPPPYPGNTYPNAPNSYPHAPPPYTPYAYPNSHYSYNNPPPPYSPNMFPNSHGSYPNTFGSYSQYPHSSNWFSHGNSFSQSPWSGRSRFPSMPLIIPMFIPHGGGFSRSRYYQQQQTQLSQMIVNVEEGDDYNMTCGGNSHSITWTFPNGSSVQNQPMIGELNPVYVTTETSANHSVLVFKNATSRLSGKYTCYVNALGFQQKAQMTVNIQPMKLHLFPEDKDVISVVQNKEYDVTCEGSLKSLSWTVNGSEISRNVNDDVYLENVVVEGKRMSQKLKFEDLQKTNEGTYVCSGYSSFNNAKVERKFNLKVTEDSSLSIPTFTSTSHPTFTQNIVTLLTNESFRIICRGDTEHVEWLGPPLYERIPEQNVSQSDVYTEHVRKKKVALVFKNITLAHEGTYKCRVNKTNEIKENKLDIKVVEPAFFNTTASSYTAKETENVTLECVVGGRPKPSVSWYFWHTLIDARLDPKYQLEGDTLIVKNISYQNAGKYICKASQPGDRGQMIERAVTLDVLHKPYFLMGNITVEHIFNSVAIIECQSIANPAPLYSWFKNSSNVLTRSGIPAVDLQNNTLEINLTKSDDFGNYICNASNSYGSNVQQINVIPMRLPLAPKLNILYASKDMVTFTLHTERNATVTHFNVEYKDLNDNTIMHKDELKGHSWDHVYALQNLKEKHEYSLRVRSVNAMGFSDFSSTKKFVTSLANKFLISNGVMLCVLFKILYNFLVD